MRITADDDLCQVNLVKLDGRRLSNYEEYIFMRVKMMRLDHNTGHYFIAIFITTQPQTCYELSNRNEEPSHNEWDQLMPGSYQVDPYISQAICIFSSSSIFINNSQNNVRKSIMQNLKLTY